MTGITLGLALLAGGCWHWSAVAAIGGAALAAWLARGRLDGWLVAAVGLAVLGCVRAGGDSAPIAPDWLTGKLALTGTISGSPVDNGANQQFVLAAIPDGPDGQTLNPARLCVTAPLLPELRRGDRVGVFGEVGRIDDADETTAGYLRYRGCAGSLRVGTVQIVGRGHGIRSDLDWLRRRLTAVLQTAAPGDRGALLAGLATGDDASLTATQRNAFIATGTSHITAVSGSNLSLLIAMVLLASGAVGSARAPWKLIAVGAVIWSYVALIGGSPPATRAAIVATLALVARAIGRRPDFITLSLVAAAGEIVVRPQDLRSLAFQLSTVSAVALVLGLGGRSPRDRHGWLVHGVYATAVTQAATSALLVPTFDRVAIYAIPANLVIGPLCGLAFALALLAGVVGLASQGLATALAFPAAELAAIVLATVRALAGLPLANAGGELAHALPAITWAGLGILVVVAMSRECQGGIVRAIGRLRTLDERASAVVSGSVMGGIVGCLLALILR